MTAPPAATEFLLRVQMRGVVEAGSLRALCADTGVTEELLRDLIHDGTLVDDDGLVYVSEQGNQRLTDAVVELVGVAERQDVVEFADVFDELDRQLKSALTAWQQAAKAGDEGAKLTAVQQWLDVDTRLRAAAIGSGAATRLAGRCLDRLAAARERVLDGDVGQLTGPADSTYHSVWFLLHEMVIRSLGRVRSGG